MLVVFFLLFKSRVEMKLKLRTKAEPQIELCQSILLFNDDHALPGLSVLSGQINFFIKFDLG